MSMHIGDELMQIKAICRRHGQDLVHLVGAFLYGAWVYLLQKFEDWRHSYFYSFLPPPPPKRSVSLFLSPGYLGSVSSCPGLIRRFISGMAIHNLPTVFMGGRGRGECCRRGGNNLPASYIGLPKTLLYSLLVGNLATKSPRRFATVCTAGFVWWYV